MPVGGDYVLTYQSAQSRLARASVTNILALVPVDQAAGTASMRTLGTGATQALPGNSARLPSVITGIRKGNGAGADTVAAPVDYANIPQTISGTVIDWTVAFWRFKTISANTTFTISNNYNGGYVFIEIAASGANTVAFNTTPAIKWANSVQGTQTASGTDYYLLWQFGTALFGARMPDFG